MSYIDPVNKIMHHFDRVNAIKAGELLAPLNVEIDLSNRCSLGCEGCHFAYTHTRGPLAGSDKPAGVQDMGDLMDYYQARVMLGELYIAGVRSVTWTGGGEPTLHPRFDDIIDYCRIPQGIYTNGTHINKERAALMKRKMTWVYVSVDYSNIRMWELYKQARRWDKLIEGIKNLVEADGDATIGLGFLLWKENWTETYQMFTLAQNMGVDYIQFRPMILYNQDAPNEVAEDTRWMEDLIGHLRYWAKVPNVIVDIDRFIDYKQWVKHPYHTCWWSKMQTVITPNGKVWTCVNRRGFADDEIGDLTKETFWMVWQRHKAKMVDRDCRVMCRGHIPNMTLDQVMHEPEGHELFV